MRCWPPVFLILLLGAVATAPGAPTTRPTTQPQTQATEPSPHLQAWFAELGDPDADVRAAALTKMLALTRADLAALREVVEQARPISPAQAAALYEIIVHVYLSGERFEVAGQQGFLGVQSVSSDGDSLPFEDPAVESGGGVVIGQRLPGFSGFQGLRDGDIILGVIAPRPTRLARWHELQDFVMRSPPGETLTFEILRQGRIVKSSIKLNFRPAAVADPDLRRRHEFLDGRQARAEAFWLKVFKPLLEEDLL